MFRAINFSGEDYFNLNSALAILIEKVLNQSTNYDMGGDGSLVARDAYSFGLNYFTGDYAPINAGVNPFPGFSGLMPDGYYKPLYNGNISAMAVNIGKLNNPILYNYQYDQLNRLVAMDAFTGLDTSNNTWSSPLTATDNYQERVAYDANGNILKYKRNGTTAGSNPLGMDSLTYKYNYDTDGYLQNNKLDHVNDSVPSTNYPDDIDNQSADNYTYDAIGNMVSDAAGGISNIIWTVYGKIATITKTSDTTVTYTYDAAGNRISKTVTPPGDGQPITTWYVRDGSGNTMAVYSVTGSDSLHQIEQDLYGSSRLGVYNRDVNADAPLPTGTNANLIGNYVESYFTRGNKQYELTNQTGNVMATITDTKTGVDTNGDGIVDYYMPNVVSANDYYPFGMMEPGRQYSIANTNYRYSFNGKEDDNDIETGMQDYGMRIYDTRLGKFLTIDPLTNQYPFYSSYQFASNCPIMAIDIDGLETTVTINGVERKVYFANDAELNRRIIAQKYGMTPLERANPDIYFRNRQQQAIQSTRTLLKGGLVAAAIAFDVFVTKGWATRIVLAYGVVNTLSDNPSANPSLNRERENQFKSALVNATGGWVGGFVLREIGAGLFLRYKVPQGLSENEFSEISEVLNKAAPEGTNSIVVQGSRANGTAAIDADLDIAIKVNSKEFDKQIAKAFGNPKPNTAKWRTLQHAIETGKIQAGEARLSGLGRQLSESLGGMKVQISIIRIGGKFDNGVQLPVLPKK